MKNGKKIISAIDIGTSKICVIIASIDENNLLEILGIGSNKSIGIKKGIVVNINDTVNAINIAIEKAENQSGEKIDSIIMGISGEHIRGINNTGVIMVQNGNQEIDNNDIKRVLKHAQTITLPLERRILHVLSQDYKVDDQTGIKDPLGMIGNRLETKVHLVTSERTREQNILKCIEKVGLDITDVVLNPLATSYSVLDKNEKDLGIALIDIGAGTTEVIVYTDGGVQHTGIIPLGGNNITLDIAHGVQTTIENAEKLKCNYGIAKEALANPEEIISSIKDSSLPFAITLANNNTTQGDPNKTIATNAPDSRITVDGFSGGYTTKGTELKRLYFSDETQQIVDGFMVSETEGELATPDLTEDSVEYYFKLLTDKQVDAKIACSCASTFNRDSYYIDIDFDCVEEKELEKVYYDIYGSATSPEICNLPSPTASTPFDRMVEDTGADDCEDE